MKHSNTEQRGMFYTDMTDWNNPVKRPILSVFTIEGTGNRGTVTVSDHCIKQEHDGKFLIMPISDSNHDIRDIRMRVSDQDISPTKNPDGSDNYHNIEVKIRHAYRDLSNGQSLNVYDICEGYKRYVKDIQTAIPAIRVRDKGDGLVLAELRADTIKARDEDSKDYSDYSSEFNGKVYIRVDKVLDDEAHPYVVPHIENDGLVRCRVGKNTYVNANPYKIYESVKTAYEKDEQARIIEENAKTREQRLMELNTMYDFGDGLQSEALPSDAIY